jgi:hypothetical protein
MVVISKLKYIINSDLGPQMEININTQCPWGTGRTDLRGVTLTMSDKYWIGSRMHFKLLKNRELQKRFKLSERTIAKYSSAFRDKKVLYDYCGRPDQFDEESSEAIVEALSDPYYKLTTPTYRKIIEKESNLTADRRNIPKTSRHAPHRSTIWRAEQRLAVHTGNGEATTNARELATADILNAVSFAAMQAAVGPSADAHNTCNLDASQFTVGSLKGKIEVKYCLVGEDDNVPDSLKVAHQDSSGVTSYFIKYYLLMFADGTAAAPVFVVADNSMAKGDIDVHEVLGLGIGTDIGSKGYVVFCKTRCGNNAFYRWLNDSILIPMVVSKKALHKAAENAITWFQLDGEPVQIKVYEDSEVIASMTEHGIVIGKPPASTTSITQPCDYGNCFKGPKTALKFINDGDVKDHFMIPILNKVVEAHQKKMKTKLKSGHKKMFSHGLVRIITALRKSMRPEMIMDSFRETGIYPYNLSIILRNCKTVIEDDEAAEIARAIPGLAAILLVKGELTDRDLARAGMRNNMNSFKDGLVVYRRRSVIMTNKQLIQRESLKRGRAAMEAVDKEEKRVERNLKKQRAAALAAAALAAADTADSNVEDMVYDAICNVEVVEVVEDEDSEEEDSEEEEGEEEEEEEEDEGTTVLFESMDP